MVKEERNSKDRLFRMIFKDRDELLGLYNALNGTHYTDAGDLEINTLENAVYMNFKNDISFIFQFQLSLYEHQSTYSPNLPLRNLFYISHLYERITETRTLYSSGLVRIPTPRFVVFYNGQGAQPEQKILRLSDAFESGGGRPALELEVTMLNINLGYNGELMEQCRSLWEYAYYVQKVRENAERMDLAEAVEQAVNECIERGVLKNLLTRCKAEVIHMSIFEYDEEKELEKIRQAEYDLGMSQGIEQGIERGLAQGIEQGLRQGLEQEMTALTLDNIEEGIDKPRILDKLMKRYGLTAEQAEGYYQNVAGRTEGKG